jgi:hypothetical protein
MRNRHDRLPKKLIRRALESDGVFIPEMEVSPDAQRFDGYFVPGPEHAAHRRDLLDRLAARPVAFEAFHATPDEGEIVACIRKLLNARHVLELAGSPGPLPTLCLFSSGRPVSGLSAVGATQRRGSPRGLYETAPGFHTRIVVLSELRAGRETLLLRLMAAGRTLRQALAELKRLPAGSREAEVARAVVIEYRVEVSQDPSPTPEDEEFLMETQGVYEAWQQKNKDEGHKEGLQEGRREDLVAVYEERFGAIPSDVRAALERARDEAVLAKWIRLFATRSADEIAAALLDR